MVYIKKIVIRVRFLTYESRYRLKTALNIQNVGYCIHGNHEPLAVHNERPFSVLFPNSRHLVIN